MVPREETERAIAAFLDGAPFAVAGASRDRNKFGNKVLRCYLKDGRAVFALNPREESIEGVACYPDLASVPQRVHGLSIVTPPHVTERVVEDAARAGVQHLWMQPGAESRAALARARALDLAVIAGGPCLLVELGWSG